MEGGKFGNCTNGQKGKGRHDEQGNYIVIAVEMLTNPFESMVINGNVAQSMTFNVYGNGNQPTDKIYFWVEMLTSPEIIIHLEIDILQIRLTPIRTPRQ